MLKLEISYGSNHKYRWHVKEISYPVALLEPEPNTFTDEWTERELFQCHYSGFDTISEAYMDFVEVVGKITTRPAFDYNGKKIAFAVPGIPWEPPVEPDELPWWKRIFGGHKRI